MFDLDYDTALPSCQQHTCRADCRALRLRANRLTTFSGLAAASSLHDALLQQGGTLCQAARATITRQQAIPVADKRSLQHYLLQQRSGRRWFFRPQAIDLEAVALTLDGLSLTALAHTPLTRLDATQRLLASLAGALVQTAPLVLLDLRHANLDSTLRRRILRHLAQRAIYGRTILCALAEAADSEGLSHWHITLQAQPQPTTTIMSQQAA